VCCRAAIDKLRQQNARLKEDLLLENKFSVRPSDPGATVLINKLQDEADLYTRKVCKNLLQRICVRSFASSGLASGTSCSVTRQLTASCCFEARTVVLFS
jgi:hypothetical protein